MNTILKVGGVPEHFNLPWRIAIEECTNDGKEDEDDVHASWKDYPEGTGKMVNDLRDGSLDVALLLSEGAVAGIAKGGGFKIVDYCVSTPLLWGIHVATANASLHCIADTYNLRYAVSRLGSGSHIMAFVHAQQQGWDTDSLQFVIVDTLQGAITALTEGRADVFLWEKFTTQPQVDAGIFRRVGELSASWPAFSVCISDTALARHGSSFASLITRFQNEVVKLRARPDVSSIIAKRFGLEDAAVSEWLSITEWVTKPHNQRPSLTEVLTPIVATLMSLELIPPSFALQSALHEQSLSAATSPSAATATATAAAAVAPSCIMNMMITPKH
jgi:hypothetical protein